MAAVLYWRLPALTPTNPGPLPWLPGIPPTLHAHPVWGDYLAKRSQLVADLAAQVQDHACQGDAEPVWASPGSHPSTALIGEIAVWRAANGINPQDPRPTGGTQLETLPALWKQRLDRHIARATDPASNARFDERQAAHTAPRRWHDDSSARTKNPNGVRTGRPRPADNTPQSSDRGPTTPPWKKGGVWLQTGPGIVPVGPAEFRSPSGLGLAVQTRAARPPKSQAAGGARGDAPPHIHAGLRSFGPASKKILRRAATPTIR